MSREAGSKTYVKVCGFRTADTVEACAKANLAIDAISFVFAKSRRQVQAKEAARLLQLWERLAPGRRPSAGGVFVGETVERLAEIAREVPLDFVQLHGGEPPEYCRAVKDLLPVRIYKVMEAEPGMEEAAALERLRPYAGLADAILLDTQGGGTGRTFDWERLPPYRAAAARLQLPIIVAGGLTPDNVGDLIRRYAPYGVDVSSGVETDGVKDGGKIAAFVERVKRPC